MTPKGIAQKVAMMRAFLAWKLAEYEELKEEIEALENVMDANAAKKLS